MASLVTFLIVFTSGVTFALLISWVPHVSNLFGGRAGRQLSFNAFHDTWSAKSRASLSDDFFHTTLAMKRRKTEASRVTTEALSALNLAVDFQNRGKHEKALRLFQHAYNLDPQHVDVLVQFGEYLEEHGDDIILAEHMYTKALSFSPKNSRAMQNRERILPLVQEMDQKMFDRIDSKRQQFYKIPENHPGLRRAKRESYFLHIYHTNAIEGNTMTLAQTRAVVETRLAIGGKSVIEHNEILGLDAALSFINSTLLRRVGNIRIQDILQIHKRVLGFVDPMEAGQFRTTQVFVGDHIPPSAPEVEDLMYEFVEWLNSDEAIGLHPIEYAALAHYKLVYIHPFFDGNGRTSRLLMNLLLMQAGFPPVIIKLDEKAEYYQHLQVANDGDVKPFIRFVAQATERTLEEFLMFSTDLSIRNKKDDGRTIIVDEE